MREATAKLMWKDNQLGTAWMLDDEHALTDWHCVADPAHRRLAHPDVDLALVIGREHARVPAKVVAHDLPTDAALLRLAGPRPLGAGTLRLGPPRQMLQAFFRESPLTWQAYAYPRDAGGQGVMLRGVIDNLDAVFDEGGQLCPVLQISVENADVRQLKAASGSAVCIDDYAVGLIRYTPFGEGKIVYATPIDAIGERFEQVKSQLRYVPSRTQVRHLDCGRERQWAAVSQAITARTSARPRRQVFFIYGARGESADKFEERVKLLDDREHQARCEPVRWVDGAPGSEADFLAWLSASVLRREERDRERVAQELARLAAGWRASDPELRRRLVIILPVMQVKGLDELDADDRFPLLHGHWLPRLLEEPAFDEPSCAGVVVLQSVTYPGSWWRFPPWINKVSRLTRHLNLRVAEYRRRKLDSDLLAELRRLTVDEISGFLGQFRALSEARRADILAFARTCQSSSEFFEYIEANLPPEE